MYDLIKSLFRNDLGAHIHYYSDSVSSREAKAEILRLAEALREELSPEQTERLDELTEKLSGLLGKETEAAFIDGFRLRARIDAEAYADVPPAES